ncbi:4-alpha-glucanotransferase [Mycolicibacterium alvei]|uniref:4-alpha-glucanotransferase n=1 Tax=Mycolicibacterium alvei TaxID=67081 RepID=A0A6N4UM44_9MYCO|nr:4-alpha-glucanotransferase [Mycolicibacterium alvei]MCV7000655.1 4-alpha-glucanotransferase [Mycolicibacterium alvei]BBX25458.1 4-alpha-glucanotransferase [Mycolicibacterium alvei]
MTSSSPALLELARRYGVAAEFDDWTGCRTAVAASTLVAVLDALGVKAGTERECADALAAHDRRYWQQRLPPIVLGQAGMPSSFWVHVTHGDPVHLALSLEDGTERGDLRQLENNRPPYDLGDRLVGEATFELPADLPLGYHRLRLREGDFHTETPVVISPAAVGLPTRLDRRRAWGLAVQLYSVRSHHSWGTGDLTDLTDLAVWSAAEHGAGFILVNPLHAAAPTAPMEPSPYLPTSRRFGNPLYLRVEAITEFASVRHRGRLRGLRTTVNKRADRRATIDRDAAWQAKRTALEQVYRVERSAGRERAYAAYRSRQGRSLEEFAVWCALAEQYGADWHAWPRALQHPGNPEVAAFAAAHPDAVDFHRWLQWVLDDQLTAAQATAVQAGMTLGIVSDLAVGVDPDGADAWALQDVLALGVTAGAPPDEFNQLGQDWSQPPWRPDRLAEQAYEPFRASVEMALRHAGGVRIDHIIGMFRLWWIPKGAAPTEGTYVRYDHDAMIGIIALEAHRAGALVVGEDLGTVEPWVRDYLRERGLFGTSILWFESDGSGQPLPAERWREYCLSSVTTHDLPPTPGYLAGEHVRLREELGLLTRSADQESAADRAAQAAWLDELRRVGLLGPDPDTDQIVTALYRYLSRTPSKLLALSLADAVGELRTQNQPGTTDEYPNWRIPLAGPDGRRLLLEDVFADPRAAALSEVVAGITGHRDGTGM